MSKGIVFSIEEFAINDGPGIRTTVFLKGCPLRCQWCHNPEGLSPFPQTMHGFDGDSMCGEYYEAEALAKRLLKDKDFYAMNGGGVTFTGGEPTLQPTFLMELLDRLSEVHTAIETSGYCPEETFKRILSKLDYVLFDIKHCDPVLHKKWTGVDNRIILNNLEALGNSGKKFVVRIPLIPGVNDSRENMEATRDLIKDYSGLERVELLKYHKTAGAKYRKVDLTYNPDFDTEANPEVHDVFGNIKTIIL